MLNMALVGIGSWGTLLVDSVQGKSDKVRFVAGATRDPAAHKAFSERFDIPLAGFDDIIADDAVDAVLLATPHSRHHDQVLAAAAAGKHVFIEKPLALTRRDAESAIAACHAAGVKIGHGFNRRFAPAFGELEKRFRRGDIGALLHVEGQNSGPSGYRLKPDMWRADRNEAPLGGMTPRGIHALDSLIHLAGPVASVYALSDRRTLTVDIDDQTSALLTFANGVTGSLASHYATGDIWRVQLYGTKGWIEMRGESDLVFQPVKGEREQPQLPVIDKERVELEAFADHVAGVKPFPVSDAEAINGIAVLEAMIRSTETGQPVAID